jgi:hypothetical protein
MIEHNSLYLLAQGAGLRAKDSISRNSFIKKLVGAGLFALLAIIALILGSKAVMANDCSKCAGNGICNGESDCERFLSK